MNLTMDENIVTSLSLSEGDEEPGFQTGWTADQVVFGCLEFAGGLSFRTTRILQKTWSPSRTSKISLISSGMVIRPPAITSAKKGISSSES